MKTLIALTLSLGMAAGIAAAAIADCGHCPEKSGKGSPTCGKEKASDDKKSGDKADATKSEEGSADKKASADTTESAPTEESKTETK